MRLFAVLLLIPLTFGWKLADRAPGAAAEDQDVGINFSHALHVTDMEIDCGDCHMGVEESLMGSDDLLPEWHDACESCHEVEEDDECATCHQNPDEPEAFPRITEYSEKFPHAKHLEAGFTCQSCHAEVIAKEVPQPYELPEMPTCVDCHNNEVVSVECLTCHNEGQELMPASHAVGFSRAHGDLARRDAVAAHGGELTCATCHDDAFCQDCHEGENLDRLSHPLNWEFTHALEAQSGAVDCASCHEDVSFCSDCHAAERILPRTHQPGVWVNRLDGGLHRIEAANDLESCISCHESDFEIVCADCHDSQ